VIVLGVYVSLCLCLGGLCLLYALQHNLLKISLPLRVRRYWVRSALRRYLFIRKSRQPKAPHPGRTPLSAPSDPVLNKAQLANNHLTQLNNQMHVTGVPGALDLTELETKAYYDQDDHDPFQLWLVARGMNPENFYFDTAHPVHSLTDTVRVSVGKINPMWACIDGMYYRVIETGVSAQAYQIRAEDVHVNHF
jgi:hypothetical protein